MGIWYTHDACFNMWILFLLFMQARGTCNDCNLLVGWVGMFGFFKIDCLNIVAVCTWICLGYCCVLDMQERSGHHLGFCVFAKKTHTWCASESRLEIRPDVIMKASMQQAQPLCTSLYYSVDTVTVGVQSSSRKGYLTDLLNEASNNMWAIILRTG